MAHNGTGTASASESNPLPGEPSKRSARSKGGARDGPAIPPGEATASLYRYLVENAACEGPAPAAVPGEDLSSAITSGERSLHRSSRTSPATITQDCTSPVPRSGSTKTLAPYPRPDTQSMKHPTKLATAIEEAEQQARSAYELNDRSMPKTPQHSVGAALFQHALEIADPTIILVKKQLPGPALALARPLTHL